MEARRTKIRESVPGPHKDVLVLLAPDRESEGESEILSNLLETERDRFRGVFVPAGGTSNGEENWRRRVDRLPDEYRLK